MKLHLLENRSCAGWSDFGSCWPRGEVYTSDFVLKDENQRDIPMQTVVAARWPDGSVKWTRHTANAEKMGCKVQVLPGKGKASPGGLMVQKQSEGWLVSGDKIALKIPEGGNHLAEEISLNGKVLVHSIQPLLSLAHLERTEEWESLRKVSCPAVIRRVELEEAGSLQLTFRFEGVHQEAGADRMRFQIRMHIHDDGEFSFEHTFFFDGDERTDRLAALGLRFNAVLKGAPYQRHIQFLTEGLIYHDVSAQLTFFRRPELGAPLPLQMVGEIIPSSPDMDEAAKEVPHWNHFSLVQDSAEHYVIQKKILPGLCAIDCRHGHRSPGTMAVSGMEGGIILSGQDFWEKYPSGLQVDALEADQTGCIIWFYAPQAEPFDFNHYAARGYPVCYEGFEYLLPSAVGIAVTSRCSMHMTDHFPAENMLQAINHRVRKPPVYVATPEDYHRLHAFGDWSLPEKGTEVEQWIEQQLENAFLFYRDEVNARGWYGLFNYGDFMHYYEACRHSWRFDVGGFAWDNTELGPTYWLWFYFLRTGREDVYSLAEALSRHTADVDCYHFGPLMGLGSRHNVRHWGCSCKEPRISMAGHHRPLYYLGGDRRIGDCMRDSLAVDSHLTATRQYIQPDGSIMIRSGPDWHALVSNWMTAYERTLDPRWREKIEAGIRGIAAAPLKLTSGPEFRYDPETGAMIYVGENDLTINMHLQACMAGPEIWLETADMLENRVLRDMVAENGKYFYLSPEERSKASGGLIGKREFRTAIYSGEMQAYAAMRAKDSTMAQDVWRELLGILYAEDHPEGFQPILYGPTEGTTRLLEIPWITTNFTAQWCLKMIVSLEYIRDSLPSTMDELNVWIKEKGVRGGLYQA